MTGNVNQEIEATVRIRVLGRRAHTRTVKAVVDTGYSGSLTLPPRVVRLLRLRHRGQTDVELGDGRIVAIDFYAGAVVWDGRRLAIEVDEANTDPLLGMELLKGSRLTMDVEPGGAVETSRIPARPRDATARVRSAVRSSPAG